MECGRGTEDYRTVGDKVCKSITEAVYACVNVWMGISPSYLRRIGYSQLWSYKRMATLDDLEVIFVVPKAWGDEDQTVVRLVGANKVPMSFRKVYYKGFRRSLEKIEVSSKIVPYTDPEDFWRVTRSEVPGINFSFRLIIREWLIFQENMTAT